MVYLIIDKMASLIASTFHSVVILQQQGWITIVPKQMINVCPDSCINKQIYKFANVRFNRGKGIRMSSCVVLNRPSNTVSLINHYYTKHRNA